MNTRIEARLRRQNILLIMAGQMAAPGVPVYGHKLVKAPHLCALAERGAVFDHVYCNIPTCAIVAHRPQAKYFSV